MTRTVIAVHGGAGREDPATREARRAGVARAAEAGWAVLARGGHALDAVIEATVVLEDDPHFNAGLGSVLTEDGVVEADAAVMAGATPAPGAIRAGRGVPHPRRPAPPPPPPRPPGFPPAAPPAPPPPPPP